MNEFSEIFGLGYATFKNKVAVSIFRNIGVDFTYPVMVQAMITNKCNSKCNMCDVWRNESEDLPASVWINAFSKLKETSKSFKVCFTGGEVFLKKDAFEIFNYCKKARIPFGITTNGYLLNQDNVNRFLELNPMNLNISLDSLNDDIYRTIRGVNFLTIVKSNIDYLMNYIDEHHLKTKVFFKTVITSHNLHELHHLAKYAKGKKVAGITFDPIKRKRKIFVEGRCEEFEKLTDIDLTSLKDAQEKLIEMKNQNSIILNSKKNIINWFTTSQNKNVIFCDAPLTRINITNDGQVRLCDYIESSIGNICNDNLGLLLKNKKVREEMKMLTSCKEPCEYCIQRNMSDYFRIFLNFLGN